MQAGYNHKGRKLEPIDARFKGFTGTIEYYRVKETKKVEFYEVYIYMLTRLHDLFPLIALKDKLFSLI
jgi:hypothetical protein